MSLSPAEEVVASKQQSGRYLCPECADTRKKRNPTLVVTVNGDHTLYDCHHCDFSGRINHPDPLRKYRQIKKETKTKITPIPTQLKQDDENNERIRKFFADRGDTIADPSALAPLTLTTGTKYFAPLKKKVPAIGFVYGNKSAPDAVKWRPYDGRKAFTQDGCADTFFGLEALDKSPSELIIVEGESDVIALASLGIKSVSVPNGAPMKISKNRRVSPEEDKKFGYVWDAHELIDEVEKIILAVDNDTAGDALAEELARRCGRAKCWRTQWPEGCKDPTDVIKKGGDREQLLSILNSSTALPLKGVHSAKEYMANVVAMYREGLGKGESTGISVVDNLFTIKEGLLYVITGFPGMGKSEFWDQVMVNMALQRSWKWAVASFENPPDSHIVKLSEKIIGKPFFQGVTPRMRMEDVEEAVDFIDDHFVFLESNDGMTTLDSIMDRCKQAVMRLGVRGLIIDPYNYIDMRGAENEHQGITRMLSELGAFARANEIAVVFVAHPAKVQPNKSGEMPIPTGHHISGSAAWFAKTDFGITVHRGDIGVEIHCWKSRFKWLGQTGDTVLGYDIPTGRYFERPPGSDNPAQNKFTRREKRPSSPKRKTNWEEFHAYLDD